MRITASKVGLASHCGFFGRVEAEWADLPSEAADRGTRFHAVIASYIATGQIPLTLEEDIAPLFASAKAWVDHFGEGNLGRGALKAEVAFAWDPATDTAEIIGENVGRNYGEHPARGKLCGSADIVAVSQCTKAGYVGDWSTGDGSQKGPQLRSLALALARTFGLDSVTVEALEVDAIGVRHVCIETLDAFALSAVAGELTESLAAIPSAEPHVSLSCTELYCPARVNCPAVVETVEQIVPVDALVRHKWGITIQGPDHAAWLYNQAKVVESAAKLVKDAVKAYIPKDGITLEDGSVLAEGSRNMPRFDKDRAVALMRALGATDEQLEGLTRTVVESGGLRVSGGKSLPRKRKAA